MSINFRRCEPDPNPAEISGSISGELLVHINSVDGRIILSVGDEQQRKFQEVITEKNLSSTSCSELCSKLL